MPPARKPQVELEPWEKALFKALAQWTAQRDIRRLYGDATSQGADDAPDPAPQKDRHARP